MDGMIEADMGEERSSLLDGEEVIEQEKRSKKSSPSGGGGAGGGPGGGSSPDVPRVNQIELFDYRKRASFATHFIDMLWVVDQDVHSGITNLDKAHDLMVYVIEQLAAQNQKISLKIGLVTGHGGGAGELSSGKKRSLNKLLQRHFQTSLITHNQGFGGYRRTKVLVDGVMYLTKNPDFIRFPNSGTKQNIIVFVTQDDSKHYPKPKKGWFNSIWIVIGIAAIVLTGGAALGAALTTGQIIAGAALGSAAVVGGLIQNKNERDRINRQYEKLSRADRYQPHLKAEDAQMTLDSLMGVARGGNYEVWSIVGDAPRKIHKNPKSLGRQEYRSSSTRTSYDWKLTTERGFKTSYVLANNSSDIKRKFTLKRWNAGGRQGTLGSQQDVEQVLDSKAYRLKNDQGKETCLDAFKVPNLSGCRAMCEVYYTSNVGEYKGNEAYYDGLNQGVTSDIWLEMMNSGGEVSLDIHEEEDFDIQVAKFTYKKQGQNRVRYFGPSSMMKDLHPSVCQEIGQVRGVAPEQKIAKILFDSGLHPQPMCMQVCPNKGPYSVLPPGSTGGCKRRKGWEYIKLVEQTGGVSFTPCESGDKASRQLIDKVLTSSAAIFSKVGTRVRLKEVPCKIVDINIFNAQGQSVFKGIHEVRRTVVKDINDNDKVFIRGREVIVPTTKETVAKMVQDGFIRSGSQRNWEKFVEKYMAAHDKKSAKQKLRIEYQPKPQGKCP